MGKLAMGPTNPFRKMKWRSVNYAGPTSGPKIEKAKNAFFAKSPVIGIWKCNTIRTFKRIGGHHGCFGFSGQISCDAK